MPKKRVKSSSHSKEGAKVSDLSRLQGLVAQALELEISDGISNGEVNQAAIRNALTLLRDCDITATPDVEEHISNMANLLPKLTEVDASWANQYG